MSKPSMRRYLEGYDDWLATEYDDMPDVDRSKPNPWLAEWMREHGWVQPPKAKRAA